MAELEKFDHTKGSAAYALGWLQSTLERKGRIGKRDWAEALEEARKDQEREEAKAAAREAEADALEARILAERQAEREAYLEALADTPEYRATAQALEAAGWTYHGRPVAAPELRAWTRGLDDQGRAEWVYVKDDGTGADHVLEGR